MTPEEPKHITFVGDSSGWSLSADGTETRWETSGPDGHLGDENRRLRDRIAALEGAIRAHVASRKGKASLLEHVKADVALECALIDHLKIMNGEPD